MSSFKPRGRKAGPLLPGVRVSTLGAGLLVSTGVPSLDKMLGGGIQIGSILLLREDYMSRFATPFQACFLSEGVVSGNDFFAASFDSALKFLDILPDLAKENNERPESPDSMKIAWQYENVRRVCSDPLTTGNRFDYRTKMSSEKLSNVKKVFWNKSSATEESPYPALFSGIHRTINNNKYFTTDNRQTPNVLRIAINGFGSIFCGSKYKMSDVTTFFTALRGLVKQSYSVAFITVHSDLFHDRILINRLMQSVDYILELHRFCSKFPKPVYLKNVSCNGLLTVNKLPLINGVIPNSEVTTDWIFRLKQGQLFVEELHLPPDFSDTPSRSQNKGSLTSSVGCQDPLFDF